MKTGGTNEIALSAAAKDKLHRMKELDALIEKHGDCDDPRMEAAFAEYRALLAEMVPLFLPLVQELADAGLLTCSMGLEGSEDKIADYRDINGHPTEVFDNGNIWLACDWAGEGGITKEASERLLPPEGIVPVN
jgi:hypothetical protein